jgi:hypothetical protein
MSTKVEKPILVCPHCNEFIIIEELNCKIFRHGVLIIDGTQIDPHCSKEMCDYYISSKLIYGCSKPFQVIEVNGILDTVVCDYI